MFAHMLARDDEISVKEEMNRTVGDMAREYSLREQLIQGLVDVGVMNESAWRAYHDCNADGYAEAKARYESLRNKQRGEAERRQEVRNVIRILRGASKDISIDSYKRDEIRRIVEQYDLKRRTKSEIEIQAEIDSYFADPEDQSADLEGFPREKVQYLKKELIQVMSLGDLLQLKEQVEVLVREGREIHRQKAVKNNPDKFPEGYIIALSSEEWSSLRSKILILNTQSRGQHTKYTPSAFTEKGLYMLATILKSQRATQTTIAIVEAFAKMRELSRTINLLSETQENEQQKALMQKVSEILSDMIDDALEVTSDETTFEMNLAFMKVKRTVKRSKKSAK